MSVEKSYRQLRQELDEILQQLESDELDIDEAIVLHEKGKAVVSKMRQYLDDVGLSIKVKIKNK